jgi:hypothetical protein
MGNPGAGEKGICPWSQAKFIWGVGHVPWRRYWAQGPMPDGLLPTQPGEKPNLIQPGNPVSWYILLCLILIPFLVF